MKSTRKVRIVDTLHEYTVNVVIAEEEADGWHVKYIKPMPAPNDWQDDRLFVLFTHAPWPKEEAE